jgi:hypothetical protein
LTVVPAAASKLVFIQQPSTTVAGAVISPAVTVWIEDAYGNLVTSNTSTVTLSLATYPTGASLGGTRSVAAVGGVATFNNLTLSMPGSYSLRASDGNLTTATSSTFTVTAAVPAKLVFSQMPSSAVAGSTLSTVTVLVEDQYGNVVTTDNSSVTLAIASGPAGGTLSGTLTVQAVSGRATFTGLSLTKAGTYTFQASDGSLAVATSTSLTVVPAAASKLVFIQQPSTTVAGAVISPAVTVWVEDAYGNLVTSNTSTVTLTLATYPAGASLGGTRSVAAVGGVATFADLTLSMSGNYSLRASDGTLTTATTSTFTATAAVATKLVFSQMPASAVASSTLSSVTVLVEDEYGNVVAGDNSSVTLAIASGPAGGTLSETLTVQAVNGVATFTNLSLTKTGTYTFQASDASLAGATSGSLTIVPAAASQVVFGQQPGSTVAGSTLGTVTVLVEDPYGNVVTSNSSRVTLAIASGPTGATLGGTTTVTAVSGVATFTNLSLTKAGTYTLAARDGTLTSSTSGSFTISPAAAYKLVFGQVPNSAVAGSTMGTVTVQVQDRYGNVVTSDNSTVTLALASSPNGGTMGGTLTVQVTNGVATFSDLVLSKRGKYRLIATDGSLLSATSIQITAN